MLTLNEVLKLMPDQPDIVELDDLSPYDVCSDAVTMFARTCYHTSVGRKGSWLSAVHSPGSDFPDIAAVFDAYRQRGYFISYLPSTLGNYLATLDNMYQLETEQDFIEKAGAICGDYAYDSRIEIPLRLDTDCIDLIQAWAAQQGRSLNQAIVDILKDYLEQEQD